MTEKFSVTIVDNGSAMLIGTLINMNAKLYRVLEFVGSSILLILFTIVLVLHETMNFIFD